MAPKGLPELAKPVLSLPPPPPHSLSNLPPHHLPWQHTGLGEVARVGIQVKTEKTNFLKRIRSPIEKRAFDNETLPQIGDQFDEKRAIFTQKCSKLAQNTQIPLLGVSKNSMISSSEIGIFYTAGCA